MLREFRNEKRQQSGETRGRARLAQPLEHPPAAGRQLISTLTDPWELTLTSPLPRQSERAHTLPSEPFIDAKEGG